MNDHAMTAAGEQSFSDEKSAELILDRAVEMTGGGLTSKMHSIAWKLLIPVPIVTIVAHVIGWLTIPPVIRDNVRVDSVETARQIVFQFKTLRKYYTPNVVTKAIKTGALKPSYDH